MPKAHQVFLIARIHKKIAHSATARCIGTPAVLEMPISRAYFTYQHLEPRPFRLFELDLSPLSHDAALAGRLLVVDIGNTLASRSSLVILGSRGPLTMVGGSSFETSR
jgi:hypothetical protein